jgi:hypothetical protein
MFKRADSAAESVPASAPEAPFDPDVSGISSIGPKGRDESRFGRAFTRLMLLWKQGQAHTYEEGRAALLADADAGIRAWVKEKRCSQQRAGAAAGVACGAADTQGSHRQPDGGHRRRHRG